MDIQTDDPWELNEVEFQNGCRAINGMDTKATVNTSILFNRDLMEKNEQDSSCTSPVRNEEVGVVPVARGVHNLYRNEGKYNAAVVRYNDQGSFQHQMQGNFQEHMQGNSQGQMQPIPCEQLTANCHNWAVNGYQSQPQEAFVNSQQYINNDRCYAELHQPVYSGKGDHYEAPQPVQHFDISTVAAPVDANNRTVNEYQPQPQEAFVNSQQYINNDRCYAKPHQPVYPGKRHYGEASHSVQHFDISTVAAPVDANNLTVNGYPFQPQEAFVNSQQYINNDRCYAELHQPVYSGKGDHYEAPQPVQHFDISTVAAPVDANNRTVNEYQPQPQEAFVNSQQYINNDRCYAKPHQPVYPGKRHYGEASHSVQQYDVSTVAAPVDSNTYQPTPQLDFSSLELKQLHRTARYRNRSGNLTEATPRRYTSRTLRGQEQRYDEELMVPDIVEEQSGCSRRRRGKTSTQQNSVQRHRQSIKDFLEFAPTNIQNLEKMNFAVTQANDELERMIYALQEMIGY